MIPQPGRPPARFRNDRRLRNGLLVLLEPANARQGRPVARDAGWKALQLRPDSAEAHWAMGCVYYRGYLDYTRALQELDAAQKINPNDSQVESTIAGVKRRQGRFDDAVAHFEKATSLSPNFATHFFDLAVTYSLLRRYGDADRPFQRALSLDPQAQFFARRDWFALLSVPAEISTYALENDPTWAPLKASAGFQDLIRKFSR